MCICTKSLQSCPALHDPMDCSLPGSPVHGILQARILEWATTSFSRGYSRPRDPTSVSYISCTCRWVLYHQLQLGSSWKTSLLLLLLLSRFVVSDSVRPHRQQPTRLLCPWDSPGKNTGVGFHFLLWKTSLLTNKSIYGHLYYLK